GKTLAAGYPDGGIGLWDVATGKERRVLRGHTREVESVAFSPDGQALASCTFDGTVILWDAGTGKELRRLRQGGYTADALGVAFSPDGRPLAVAQTPFRAGRSDCITLWELATGSVRLGLVGHQGDVNAVAFGADGRTLVSCSTDTTALVWDLPGAALA